MDSSWLVTCPPGVSLARRGADAEAAGPSGRFVLRDVSPVWAALARLEAPGERVGRLLEAVREGPPGTVARLTWCLVELARAGFLHFAAAEEGRVLATAVPMAWSFTPERPGPPGRRWVLSRFAYLHRVPPLRGPGEDELVLESPTSVVRVHLHDPRLATAVAVLAAPRTAEELAGTAGMPSGAVASFVSLLAASGLLTAAEGAQSEGSSLETWEFHDLLFHARIREGRHDLPLGATFHQAGVLPPPAAVKEYVGAAFVALEAPDPSAYVEAGPTFGWVAEQRRSVRAYGTEPLTVRQLGEFLYRVARVRTRSTMEVPTGEGPPVVLEMTERPYPAAGGLYEIEIYPAVRSCQGLQPGLYHYDPVGHRLGRVSGLTSPVEALLAGAGGAAGVPPEEVQVLLVLAARFARLSWKYSAIAYALTLKNVGVLYQTMYLTATAMGLAPCGIGAGNADLFAHATGGDYYAESSVGEFLLGSAPR